MVANSPEASNLPDLDQELRALLASVTPQSVAAWVRQLVAEPGMADGNTLAVHRLTRRLLGERGHDPVATARMALPLRHAIARALASVPGMTYVDGG